MAGLICLVISVFLVPDKISAVTFYKVAASTTRHHDLKNETGCYVKTGYTTKAHDFKIPVFMKTRYPVRYLLQLESNGNWAISDDRLGNNVIIEQQLSNYPPSPDTTAGTWVIRGNRLRSIPSLKVTANEDCKEIDPPTKEPGSISYYWYVEFGVAGVFLLVLYVYHVYLCINPPNIPIIEDNPDYGKMEEYDDDRAYQYGISGVVDQKDYYDTEL